MRPFLLLVAFAVGVVLACIPLVSDRTESPSQVRLVSQQRSTATSSDDTTRPTLDSEVSERASDVAASSTGGDSSPSLLTSIPTEVQQRLAVGLQAQRKLVALDSEIRRHAIDHFPQLSRLLGEVAKGYDILAEYDRASLAKSLQGDDGLDRYLMDGQFDLDLPIAGALIDYVLAQVNALQAAVETRKAPRPTGSVDPEVVRDESSPFDPSSDLVATSARRPEVTITRLENPAKLEAEHRYRCDAGSALFAVSDECPLRGNKGIKSVREVPLSGGFRVLEVQAYLPHPWYRIEAFDGDQEASWSGWVDGATLTDRVIFQVQTPEPPTADATTLASDRKHATSSDSTRSGERKRVFKLKPSKYFPENPSSDRASASSHRASGNRAKNRAVQAILDSTKRTVTREFLPTIRTVAKMSVKDDDLAERYLERKFGSHVAADPNLTYSILASNGLCQVTFTFRQANLDLEICITAQSDGYEHVAVTPIAR